MEGPNSLSNLSPDTLTELSVPPDHFRKTDLIGKGGYGKVYRCITDDDVEMVSKIVTVSDYSGIMNLNEVDIMSKLRHPNLMESRGVKTILDDDSNEGVIPSVIIFMDMAFCDLHVYIFEHNPLISEKNKLLYDTVQGLSFMHSNDILHLDIKPSNVLIFKDCQGITAKLTDFGNSITVGSEGVCMSSIALTTVTYRAPELFLQVPVHTKSSDIWSYGILVLFVITGKTTFSDIDNVRQEIYDKFSPNGRFYIKKTIHECFLDQDLAQKYIKLLYKIIIIESPKRATAPMVVNDHLFDNIRNSNSEVNGGVMYPTTDRPTKYDIIQYRGFDFMLRGFVQLEDSIQTIFLAGDLYQRVLHTLDLILYDDTDNHKWSIFSCVSMTCLWMAHKMIEPSTLSVNDIVKMSSHAFSNDSVRRTEEIIMETFGGIIYRKNLYTTSKCHHKMSVAFDSLYNCFLYHQFDLDKWEEMSLPQCGDDCVSTAGKSFDFIYSQTYHHKISTGIVEIDTPDYVEYIYRRDLNNFKEGR